MSITSISNREEINSAIGSWSGFIYQGLCGVLVVLRMLRENPVGCKGYALQLDALEDFSILDENGKIFSMHQCKSVKGQTDYKDEFAKMQAKVANLKSQLHDAANPQNYFHCNREVTIDDGYGIKPYPFETGKTYCSPGHIQRLLESEIEHLKKTGSDTHAVRAALETIVNGEVLDIQQEYFDAKGQKRLWKISRGRKIEFAQFEGVLNKTILQYNPGDFLLQMKESYAMGMMERALEDDKEEITNRVTAFVNRLGELSHDEMKQFIQRINPKDKLADTLECWHKMTSEERINYLYEFITDIPLDTKDLHWKTSNSLQTPSTLGNDERVHKISRKIYENQANLDFPWIYDWIVGKVDEHIDNIEEAAHIINKTEEAAQPTNIFHIKKVGILTKQEKQNGTFD